MTHKFKLCTVENEVILTDVNKTPTFNLKAVVQETGIKPDTLRAWERRYGLPQPERTAGRHRLYSQYDIDMLKWLQARQDEGLSISRAVDLWRQLEAEGESPVEAYGVESEETPSQIVAGDSINQLREGWIAACLKFDEHRARQILSQAFALFPMETVCFKLLQQSLAEIGAGWYEGRVTVQQEHFASALAIRQLETLLNAAPPPNKNGRIVVACAPEELHTFSALLITLLLRHRGWDVIYLGADVPPDRLSTTLSDIRPQLLIVTAQTLHTAGTLPGVALLARETNTPMAYGGGVFTMIEEIVLHIPAYYLGDELSAAPQVVERLVSGSHGEPQAQLASPAHQAALDQFTGHRSAIEADVLEALASADVPLRYLKNANRDLGDNIQAALALGDMDLLNHNLEWLQGLLVNFHYRMPEEVMKPYMAAYQKAAKEHLDQAGQPILEWLAHVN
ncbi:MAG: MerR family transcriptional regulator [Anaerolineales bacterium]|nr:MerR family transcriptional regulator [Anaerolineales bacterium]